MSNRDATEKLEELGWRQFSIFLGNASTKLNEYISDLSDEDILMVLPYSCAVVNGDFLAKEPTIEILKFRKAQENKALLWARDPRRIHVGLNTNNFKTTIEAAMYDRYFIPHELLLEFSPKQDYVLFPRDIRALKFWIAKRYTRQAFPDAFNQLIRKVKGKLKDKLVKYIHLEHIQGVYLNLDPLDEELDEDDVYELSICVILSEEGLGKYKDQISTFFQAFEIAFSNIEGIEFTSPIRIASESEITLYEYRQLIRFDDYDFLSFKEDHDDMVVTEP